MHARRRLPGWLDPRRQPCRERLGQFLPLPLRCPQGRTLRECDAPTPRRLPHCWRFLIGGGHFDLWTPSGKSPKRPDQLSRRSIRPATPGDLGHLPSPSHFPRLDPPSARVATGPPENGSSARLDGQQPSRSCWPMRVRRLIRTNLPYSDDSI
ncbi:hypothetical protein SMALB_3564 [Streptomyces malaysiensis]|uniref:Uncharacterized protein n=1 Tax=Streptomyces malaysiensis TaxID=92644 RepID=A0A7X5X503_STRMQ|nr:hypothetical protein [Streptomyces malaysiensis]